jgi:expansin (peptidoglycan-binding protein)
MSARRRPVSRAAPTPALGRGGPVRCAFDDSNPFFYRIQASHHRYGIAAMEYDSGSGFVSMTRTAGNHFEASPPGIDEAVVRVTATTGESLTETLGDPTQADVITGSAQFSPCDEVFSDGFEPISS